MWLSRGAISRHLKEGNIIIEPFDERKLKTASYDVSVGKWFWREKHPEGRATIHNLYDENSTSQIWEGPFQAELAEEVFKRLGFEFKNIKPSDKIILLRPGETILGHTEEFIGGRNKVVTKMQARSSLGRNFIEVCKDAGLGDVGYVNRWTMEITNNSQYFTIPLVVGRRIAQIIFHEVEADKILDYSKEGGKYQSSNSMEELKKSWNPQMMLPKMHLDWEVNEPR